MDIFGKIHLDNSKRYLALAMIRDRPIVLHTTRDSIWCSYGIQRWVDDSGDDFGQIDMPYLGVIFLSIVEIPDEIADKIDNISKEYV